MPTDQPGSAIDLEALLAAARAVADETGTALVPPLTGRILQSIAKACRATFSAGSVSIAVLAGDELDYVAAAGRAAEAVVGMRLPLGRGISGWVAASGQAVGISEVSADPRFDRARAESIGYVPDAMIVVPIIDGDESLGVLAVLDPGAVGIDTLELAGDFADHAAVTIRQSRTGQQVGLTVIAALAEASEQPDVELAAVLAQLGERGQTRAAQELAAVAELFQRLSALGDLERELAIDLLHDAIVYAERIRARR